MPYRDQLPRLLRRERPRACVMCYCCCPCVCHCSAPSALLLLLLCVASVLLCCCCCCCSSRSATRGVGRPATKYAKYYAYRVPLRRLIWQGQPHPCMVCYCGCSCRFSAAALYVLLLCWSAAFFCYVCHMNFLLTPESMASMQVIRRR